MKDSNNENVDSITNQLFALRQHSLNKNSLYSSILYQQTARSSRANRAAFYNPWFNLGYGSPIWGSALSFDDENIDLDMSISSFEDLTITEVDQNKKNKERIEYLDKKVTPLLLTLIKSEDIEFGFKSQSAILVEEQLKENAIATQTWFNQLYIRYFASDEKILQGILKIVENLEYKSLSPAAEVMALASLTHKSDEVKELGVRIFENWGTIESYSILKNVHTETKWLLNYINQVVEDLAETLCLS